MPERLRRALLAALLPALLLAGGETRAARPNGSAVVTRVSDGDTIWVRVANTGKRRKLRLLGIDAPEICQRGGQEARAALAARVLGQRVELESRLDDRYGRALVHVTYRGEDVARWLVQSGLAWSPGFRWHPGPYADEERAARAARRGLWADTAPVLPRDFRRQHGPCA